MPTPITLASLVSGADYALVCAFLHWNGTFYSCLSRDETVRFRRLADGFGTIDPSMPNFSEMLWDWSHVRDSSPEAISNIAKALRTWCQVNESAASLRLLGAVVVAAANPPKGERVDEVAYRAAMRELSAGINAYAEARKIRLTDSSSHLLNDYALGNTHRLP